MPQRSEFSKLTFLPEVMAQEFLETAAHFKLGHLPTESRHPRTTRLSQLANENLVEAISLLKDVEVEAMRALTPVLQEIEKLSLEVYATLKAGGRVFLCGCGATGRLSLSLETFWREEANARNLKDFENKVISFMAGGDYAMVRSIENFEDHPEYGARQLNDLNFNVQDLMIGTTEGGETPFVIGAVEEAARISNRKPYLLFCNPTTILKSTVERSRIAIENPKINSIAIETGPMALAGSTRLQATTALMLATGSALFATLENPIKPKKFMTEFIDALEAFDFSVLAPLIEAEAKHYQDGSLCVHRTSRYAISVLTDTTERSPTFSLLPFENALDQSAKPAWTYLVHSEATNSTEAWQKTLRRSPRPLSWHGFKEKYGEASLSGFDFSPSTIERRNSFLGPSRLAVFDIEAEQNHIQLKFSGVNVKIPRLASLLCEHLFLKIALNISSTLTMGRLGRFSGNLMLYVRAANNKLVDRAIRYIQILLNDRGINDFSYEKICLTLFEVSHELAFDEPAVWRTFEKLHVEKTGSAPHR